VGSYKVLIKASAARELEAVPKKDRQRIATRIQDLTREHGPEGAEKLSGQKRYRIRQGNYRIVYSIDDHKKEILVFKIGHRREVYR
jgi:mRNA interferase RelE/StbE